MNIEQYRALKAEEEKQTTEPTQPVVEQPVTVEVVQPVVEAPPVEDKPTTVEINGEEVTLDELKNGYLRQSDYTKKTQEVSKQRKESQEAIAFFEHLKANPELAKQLNESTAIPRSLDPTQSKVMELEEKMYDMMIEREIETLQSKYPDFEIREVLEVASEKGLTNLEDAYHLTKASASTDVNKLKEQVRKELLIELEKERTSTQTIITPTASSAPTSTNQVYISEAERKVASMMKLSDADYIKWRDVDKKK